jgi:hypothetical protein
MIVAKYDENVLYPQASLHHSWYIDIFTVGRFRRKFPGVVRAQLTLLRYTYFIAY